MGAGKTVTIASMAEQLGVSTATVAKALNGQGRISAGTIERVRNLAREMKYIPNIAARSLRTNIRDSIGVLITSDIVNPWYSQLVSLLEAELAGRGLTMLLALGKNDLKKSELALEKFFGGRVGGILAGPIPSGESLEVLQATRDRRIPLVIFSNLENYPVNFVAIDQAAGGKIAIQHLLNLGHRKILYLGSSPNGEAGTPGTRYAAYAAEMKKYSLKAECLSFDTATSARHNAFDATTRLLRESRREELPTAFLCHNDDVAIGALLALQQAEIRVPEDLSLIGFDDIAESSFCLPGLTTIGGVMQTMASELVLALERAIHTESAALTRKFIIPKLILRSTTAKPRSQE